MQHTFALSILVLVVYSLETFVFSKLLSFTVESCDKRRKTTVFPLSNGCVVFPGPVYPCNLAARTGTCTCKVSINVRGKVAIFGSTGTLGPHIISQLLSNPDHFKQITAVTESNVDDPKFSNIKSKGVRVVHANFSDKQSLVDVLKGQDVVIILLSHPFARQILLVDAAVEAGVKHFIPSEFGGDIFAPKLLEVVALEQKRTVQKHLLEYVKQGKITYTIFITGVFFDWGLRTGFLDFDLKANEFILYDDGKNKFTSTNTEEIGAFVVAALKLPDLSVNKTLRFANLRISQLDILHSLEKVTGKKWTVKAHSTVEEAKKQIPELIAKGDPRGFQLTLLSLVYSGDLEYKTDNHLFPEVKLLTLDQSVEAVIKGL